MERVQHSQVIGLGGALAVALGIGAALAGSPAVAQADTSGSERPSTGEASAPSATGSSPRSDRRSAGPAKQPARPAPPATTTMSTSRNDPVVAKASTAPATTTAGAATQQRVGAPAGVTVPTAFVTAPTAPTAPTAFVTAPTVPSVPSVLPITMLASAGRQIELATAAASVLPRRTATTTKTLSVSAVGAVSAVSTAVAPVPVEAETLVLMPARAGSTYSDRFASGGRALLMSTNSTASTTKTLPAFTSLVIRARGDQFKGSPTMTVSVNGKVVATATVSATAWTDYTVPVSVEAGTHTISVAFTNDLRASAGRDRNLRLDKITVIPAAPAPAPAPVPAPIPAPAFFPTADWLWKPIGANPTLAANSATWVGYLSAPKSQRVAELYHEGTTLIPATAVTNSTPRYDITFTQPWGSDPFASHTVPIPLATHVPQYPGGDGHLAIQDPVTGQVFGLWQAHYDTKTNKWTASWGGMTPLNGNGIDTSGSATATNLSRYAGVVTAKEMTAAIAANSGLNHALVFATDIAGPGFVGPATKSDGTNIAGVATPIPEGYRVQLNPAINVDAIVGITAGEKVIAKTLQTHGAYVVDQGAARMAFAFEAVPGATDSNPGKVWTDAGLAWDYYDMAKIPWAQLRVLAP